MAMCHQQGMAVVAALLLCSGPASTEAGRVLAFFYLPAYSHFIVFEPFLKNLAERGHQVDVVSSFPQKTSLPNYTDISIEGFSPTLVDYFSFEEVLQFNFFNGYQFVWVDTRHICKKAMESAALKALAQSRERYDLVLLEVFGADCAYGYAHLLGAPVIGITSHGAVPSVYDRVGNPDNPSYMPAPFTPHSPRMTLWQRAESAAAKVYTVLGEKVYAQWPTDRLLREVLGPSVPPLSELVANTSLVMVNSHFTLHGAQPTVPAYVEVGGMHVDPRPGKLPERYRAFVEGAGAAGVLLVSFGTVVRANTMPPEMLRAFLAVLGALPQRVVWKVDPATLSLPLPPNVFAEHWLPQQQLLCHPQVRAFLTHGGLGSMLETVYWGVPTVVVPLFGDQPPNAMLMEERGMARVLQFRDITAESLAEALNAVLNDPRYRESAKEMSQRFRDRPQTPLQTAVYWTEYVMRHRGAPHMRSAALHLSWYEVLLLDVAALTVAIVSLLLAALWLGTRAIFCGCGVNDQCRRKAKAE